MNCQEESILIKQLQKGNELAFNLLYSKYFSKLYGFSTKLTGSKSDAEEIVQEVFGKIWEIKDDIDPSRDFGSFLFTIAKNKIYNKARHKVYEYAYKHYRETHFTDSEELTDWEVSYNETCLQIDNAINRLPEKRRKIFIMSRIQGVGNKEIAKLLGTSISNIENHINKATKKIRQLLIND